MAQTHRRKKAPAEVRRQLLTAAIELALEAGPAGITLDAVARRAGVSKGGLQYHFPNRYALLDALFEGVAARFQHRIETLVEQDGSGGGKQARAYLHATDATAGDGEDDHWRAVAVVMLGDPEFRGRWSSVCREAIPHDPASNAERHALHLICRLAADGLWLNDLLGFHEITPEARADVVRTLAELSRDR